MTGLLSLVAEILTASQRVGRSSGIPATQKAFCTALSAVFAVMESQFQLTWPATRLRFVALPLVPRRGMLRLIGARLRLVEFSISHYSALCFGCGPKRKRWPYRTSCTSPSVELRLGRRPALVDSEKALSDPWFAMIGAGGTGDLPGLANLGPYVVRRYPIT